VDASAGAINSGGVINSSGTPITLPGADVNLPAGGPLNAGAGTVTITSTAANGAVSLGAGLSGLGLSSAELGRISAGALLVNGGTIATDAHVIVSGIGTGALTGSSVQIGPNVTPSGVLSVAAPGDDPPTAGAPPP